VTALRLAALTLAACLAAGVAARGETATRDKGSELPLNQFHQAAVDPGTGRVYVVGNAWIKPATTRGLPDAGLVVLSPEGALITTSRRFPDASSVTVSPGTHAVFVGLLKDNAIVQLDPGTLAEVRRFPLPATAGCPDWLQWASGRIWYATNCGDAIGIASLDPASGQVQVAAANAFTASHPMVAAAGRYLVGADTESSGGALTAYRITGVRLLRTARIQIGYTRDLRVTADGRVLFAVGRGAGARTLPKLGQSTAYNLPTTATAGAVTASPDGRVVLATAATGGMTVLAFRSGTRKPFWKTAIGSYDGLPAYAGLVHTRLPRTVLVFDSVYGTEHPFVQVFRYSSPGGAKR
jgi:hypothetical protein